MSDINLIINKISDGMFGERLKILYGNKPGVISKQKERYLMAIENFKFIFSGKKDVELFSTPGRTEVGGNHTDHNAGRILAAAVNLDIIAVVAKNEENIVRVKSEGYPEDIIDINELMPKENEKYTSAALIRGVCARLKELGYKIGGFEAYTT